MATDVVEVLEDAIAMDEIQSAAQAFARLRNKTIRTIPTTEIALF